MIIVTDGLWRFHLTFVTLLPDPLWCEEPAPHTPTAVNSAMSSSLWWVERRQKKNKQKTQIFYPIHCFLGVFCQNNRVVPNTTRKSSLIPVLNHEEISNLHWTNKKFSKNIYHWGFRSQSIKPHFNCEEEQIHGPWESEATEHDYKESIESMSVLWNNLMVYCEEVPLCINKKLNGQ